MVQPSAPIWMAFFPHNNSNKSAIPTVPFTQHREDISAGIFPPFPLPHPTLCFLWTLINLLSCASFHATQRGYFFLPPSSYPSFPLNITGVYGWELCRVQQCRGEWCRAPSTQTVPLRSRAHPHHICQWRPHQPSTRRREIFQATREGEGEIVTLPILTPSSTPLISLPSSLKYSMAIGHSGWFYTAVSQVCFACRKKKFSVFTRSTVCHICKRYV